MAKRLKNTQCDQLILDSYKSADKKVIYHEEDPDLPTIELRLPGCPPLETIEGYGLHPKKQKWHVTPMPQTLIDLQNKEVVEAGISRSISIDEIWRALSRNPKKYRDEIKFIDQQIYRSIYGYWFFIKGKPTYITGWHYEYINDWKIDIGLPEYRDRDRKFFVFAKHCYNDPHSYGFNYPKHRREGATNKAQCINYWVITRIKNAHGGIQSMTETHARKVFQSFLIGSWKTLPFYFKPQYEGSTDPKNMLRFNPPGISVTGKSGAAAKVDSGLGSAIDFKESGIKGYDTYKLHFYHGDEVGKCPRVDVYKRHEIIKPCLAQGPNIHGLEINTSTVGDMDKAGGRTFFNMCKLSQYDKRNANDQTPTGLYTLFLPAYEGFDGYVDEFGQSVTDTPTKEQAEFLRGQFDEKTRRARMMKEELPAFDETVGAKQFIQNQIQGFLENDDSDSALEYMRQHPTRYRHCWRSKPNASGFDLKIIEDRLEDLNFIEKEFCVRGDLEWEDGIPAHPGESEKRRVVFEENEKGKFVFSMRLPDAETNMCYYDPYFEGIGSWVPENTKLFVAGGDPFKFSKTHFSRKSNGGGAVKYKRDHLRDTDDKARSEWKSNRFVCTYSNRVEDKHKYAEDMLMMCIYWGCQMFPEIDVPLLWDYFEERGYAGFLMYRIDKSTGKLRKTPGSTSVAGIKQELFGALMTYIKNNGMRECHREFLEQCRDIESIEQMKDFDLFTACGYAEYAATRIFEEANAIETDPDIINLGEYYRVTA